VIPFIRGGPDEPWNRELLHSSCNGSKGRRMSARSWALARQHDVDVVPSDPAALRHGMEAVASGLRRIELLLADFEAAGLELPFRAELPGFLTKVHAAANRIGDIHGL
jgi:hypothetical protein